jgi:glycosyltransferase involved in cell wall biosynthesis
MDKRIRLGVPFNYKSNWIAGPYYIANLIAALDLLSDEKKPHVIIYFDSYKAIKLLKRLGYPYISFKKQKSIIVRACNKLSRTFIKKNLFTRRLSPKKINLLFPAVDNDFFRLIPLSKKLYWIPDFQEHFYPHFFTDDVLSYRKKLQQTLVDNNAKILFSSNSSQSDFLTIYPNAQNKTYVLPFAVSHSEKYHEIDIHSLLEKYNLPGDYYFCANQFWAHKNHITVLKAIALLMQKDKNVVIAFSGNQGDARNPHFFESLMQFVSHNNLETNIRFLGFIERNEQLALMKNCQAVIQPSLFEGWSTVVEDSKSLNKFLIISDIPIHREQIKKNALFFDPLNEMELAGILEDFKSEPEFSDYTKNRTRFAEAFYSILEQTVSP